MESVYAICIHSAIECLKWQWFESMNLWICLLKQISYSLDDVTHCLTHWLTHSLSHSVTLDKNKSS